MALDVAIQMDPIETFDIRGDSTFAIMLEAQARGHKLFCYEPASLSLYDGRLSARGTDIEVRDEAGNHFAKAPERTVDLSEFDCLHMRQDPPFDMNYITITHMLEHIHPATLVVNDPCEVRNAPEKLFVARFGEFMPPTLVSRDETALRAFWREHGDIILKPLYGNGGAGVFRVRPDDDNFSSLLEMFGQLYREPFMAQQYLKDVRAGDKRIILVDGQVAGAINRVPADGETRSNMHVGGRPEATELTAREHDICRAIGPELKARGLIFVGIDVIGGMMTEINVTSPTGIREVNRFGGNDIAAMIWDVIEARV